jgi:hypothetical protein
MAKSDASYVYVTVGTAYKLLRANASMTDVNAVTSYQELVAAGIRLDPDTKNRYFRNEPVSFTDITSLVVQKGVLDTPVVIDSIDSIGVTKALDDSFGFVDLIEIVRHLVRGHTDNFAFTDALAAETGLTKNDAVTVSEILAKDFGTGLSDSSVISDVPVLGFGGNHSDAATLADVFARAATFSRTFTDTITLDDFTDVDAITKDTTAAKTNVIGFQDIHSFGTSKPVTETTTVSELAALGFEKPATDSVGVSEAFQKVTTFSRQNTETATLSDVSSHSFQKPVTDGATLSEVFQKDVAFARTITEAVSFSEQTVAAMERQFSDTATISENISIQVSSLASSVLNAGALNTVPFNN